MVPFCQKYIQGIHIPSSRITTHYVPLHCEHFSHVQHQYDPNSLPLWNNQTFIKQSIKVQTALTTTASEWLTKKYVIKGLPLLTTLTFLSFPLSFPYNFMHLIWYNLIVNLNPSVDSSIQGSWSQWSRLCTDAHSLAGNWWGNL